MQLDENWGCSHLMIATLSLSLFFWAVKQGWVKWLILVFLCFASIFENVKKKMFILKLYIYIYIYIYIYRERERERDCLYKQECIVIWEMGSFF